MPRCHDGLRNEKLDHALASLRYSGKGDCASVMEFLFVMPNSQHYDLIQSFLCLIANFYIEKKQLQSNALKNN